MHTTWRGVIARKVARMSRVLAIVLYCPHASSSLFLSIAVSPPPPLSLFSCRDSCVDASQSGRAATDLLLYVKQAPTDMWNYQEILRDLKPTLLIEFGYAPCLLLATHTNI